MINDLQVEIICLNIERMIVCSSVYTNLIKIPPNMNMNWGKHFFEIKIRQFTSRYLKIYVILV